MTDDLDREIGDAFADPLVIDHLRLIRDRAYFNRKVASIGALPRGSFAAMEVLHEADDFCCAQQAWPVTVARLFTRLPDDAA